MSDEPNARDVDEAVYRALNKVLGEPDQGSGTNSRRWDLALSVAADLAPLFAQARREGAAEVVAKVEALADEWDHIDRKRGDQLRAALRGDA